MNSSESINKVINDHTTQEVKLENIESSQKFGDFNSIKIVNKQFQIAQTKF
jgi:hypothetical protein